MYAIICYNMCYNMCYICAISRPKVRPKVLEGGLGVERGVWRAVSLPTSGSWEGSLGSNGSLNFWVERPFWGGVHLKTHKLRDVFFYPLGWETFFLTPVSTWLWGLGQAKKSQAATSQEKPGQPQTSQDRLGHARTYQDEPGQATTLRISQHLGAQGDGTFLTWTRPCQVPKF